MHQNAPLPDKIIGDTPPQAPPFSVLSFTIQTLIPTQADQKDLAPATNTSTTTDRMVKANQVINWSGAKILAREHHHSTGQLNSAGTNWKKF